MRIKLVICLLFSIILISGCTANEVPEFPITEDMSIIETRTDETDGVTVTLSIYNVVNADYETFLSNYAPVLEDAGWVITSNGSPSYLDLEKDKHKATVIVYETDDVLKAEVYIEPHEKK